jgi:hypothetical protein
MRKGLKTLLSRCLEIATDSISVARRTSGGMPPDYILNNSTFYQIRATSVNYQRCWVKYTSGWWGGKIPPKVKTTIGRLREMASLFTAIGTMAMPLAVLVLLEAPKDSLIYWWGTVLMVVGLGSLIYGWRFVIREEQQRRREAHMLFYILSAIAEKLGVDIHLIIGEMEKIKQTKKTK